MHAPIAKLDYLFGLEKEKDFWVREQSQPRLK